MVGLGGICGQSICGRKATSDLNNRVSSELKKDQKIEGGGAGFSWLDGLPCCCSSTADPSDSVTLKE